jgi:hypothetical protein
MDVDTGEKFAFGNNHRAFGIPMQYWALIVPPLVLVLLIFAGYRHL